MCGSVTEHICGCESIGSSAPSLHCTKDTPRAELVLHCLHPQQHRNVSWARLAKSILGGVNPHPCRHTPNLCPTPSSKDLILLWGSYCNLTQNKVTVGPVLHATGPAMEKMGLTSAPPNMSQGPWSLLFTSEDQLGWECCWRCPQPL